MFSSEFYFVPFIISYSLVSNSILFQFFSSYNIFKIPKVPYGHFTIIMTMMTVSFISFFSVDHLNAIKESESCENVKSTQFINQHCYYCRSQVQNLLLLLLFVHFQLFFFVNCGSCYTKLSLLIHLETVNGLLLPHCCRKNKRFSLLKSAAWLL